MDADVILFKYSAGPDAFPTLPWIDIQHLAYCALLIMIEAREVLKA